MNSKAVTKHYMCLTVEERLALILAAEGRGDDLEQQRLRDSAPIRCWQLPNYLMRHISLNTLSLVYIAEQLDRLAVFWHALWRFDDTEDAKPLDWKVSAESSAYAFSCNAEAWQRFCEGLNIDAAPLTASNYLGWMLPHAEARMPKIAPSRDELCATLREYGLQDPNPPTADDFLASWQRLFDKCTGRSNERRS